MFRPLLDALFPPLCLACGQGKRSRLGLCSGCLEAVQFHGGRGCYRCGRSSTPHRCVPLEHRYQSVLALAAYKGPWRQAVLAVKAGRDRETALDMAGELFALARSLELALPDAVVPAPGAGRDWRRFDAVELVAKKIAEFSAANFLQVFKRLPGRRPQVEMGRDDRLRGLEKFIRYTGGEVLKNKDVWLIDDVFTTGGTAAACTDKLLAAGVKSVSVLVLGN
ncbi:MAG: ComF family protein [Firmicutes bacterium]|nr:ComF family protein [Bacillota bacterium]